MNKSNKGGPARQEQEPVAKWDASAPLVVTPHTAFQSTPPRREWVGLTDEERDSFWRADQMTGEEWRELFDAIEAKLKEKNNG